MENVTEYTCGFTGDGVQVPGEESSTRLCEGKISCGIFPHKHGLKQGVALSPLLFSFALEYAIRRLQANQNGLKLNGTHQLLVYAAGVNVLGGSVHSVKKNTEALVVASKEIGLEGSVGETKHMVVSQDQNAGRSRSIKTDINL